MTDKITPAFPTAMREWRIEEGDLAGNTGFEYVDPGMTLRDYFAAKASEKDIQANIEGPMQERIVEGADGRKHITHRTIKYTREQAKYRYADQMMKAREQ